MALCADPAGSGVVLEAENDKQKVIDQIVFDVLQTSPGLLTQTGGYCLPLLSYISLVVPFRNK